MDNNKTARTNTRVSRVTVDNIKQKPDRVVVSDRKKSVKINRDQTGAQSRSRQPSRNVSISKTETRTIQSSIDKLGRAQHRMGSRSDKNVNITNKTINNTTNITRASRGSRHRDGSRRVSIDVDVNNTVVVKGRPTRSHHRPHISWRLRHDIHHHVHRKPHWRSHSGFYFSFTWSNNTCGRVVYLPYTYHHSWHRHVHHHHRPYYGLSYYYPRYHRKYIFVSVGGYWPSYYRYRRYYWYGCHPHYWYGSTIITEPTRYVTYNIYNYDAKENDYGYGFSSSSTPYYTLGEPKEEIIDEPEYESPADLSFDHGVTLFEAGNYEDAVQQFREAVTLAPDDVILPFTYSQALFANGEYARAASVLREAVGNIPDDELTIYFPRGLYAEDKLLESQIKQLESAIVEEPFDADYQLLLGYQHLGLGDLDKAHGPLVVAAQNPPNRLTAEKLLTLAAKLEEESRESD